MDDKVKSRDIYPALIEAIKKITINNLYLVGKINPKIMQPLMEAIKANPKITTLGLFLENEKTATVQAFAEEIRANQNITNLILCFDASRLRMGRVESKTIKEAIKANNSPHSLTLLLDDTSMEPEKAKIWLETIVKAKQNITALTLYLSKSIRPETIQALMDLIKAYDITNVTWQFIGPTTRVQPEVEQIVDKSQPGRGKEEAD